MSTTDSTVDPAVETVDEQQRREAQLVADVVASFDDCADPRLRELMTGIVEHVHAFIREPRLTEAEWSTAIDFLTRAGHITDDRRQEFILLSDVLGASMQTIAVNNAAYAITSGTRSAARGWRCGRPTRTASTTCSTATIGLPVARICLPTPMVRTGSGA